MTLPALLAALTVLILSLALVVWSPLVGLAVYVVLALVFLGLGAHEELTR